ncbi:hypothetical protein C8F04DRAFT_1194749 [Mycena alexandri]|uniref:Uncharacterized protein n=1 Tax=Mycena alexandri TaxID=1745969 RepID=A0AAD6S8L6_9AGAR|nr:hypothetical protein C8F04DRAFT_1194749 [Mycena alexandri]
MTHSARAPVLKLIHDPTRLNSVPSVPETIMSLHQAPNGMLALPDYLSDDLNLDLEFEDFLRGTPPASSNISYSGLSSANSTAAMISSTIFAAGSSHQAANFPNVPPIESTHPTVPHLDQPNLLRLLGQKRTADSIASAVTRVIAKADVQTVAVLNVKEGTRKNPTRGKD